MEAAGTKKLRWEVKNVSKTRPVTKKILKKHKWSCHPTDFGFVIAGVTILLSLTVFSQVVAETMPATSDAVPLLGKRERKKLSGVPESQTNNRVLTVTVVP